MNWKEKFDEMKKGFLAVKHNEWWASDEDFIKDFISTEIIKKILDDIQADRQQLLKAVEEMKEELPTILWKDEHEPNLIKRAKNHALDQVLDLLKAKDYIQEFDNQIPREGL